MKFGMPAMIELSSIEENIELAKKLKLSFIELNLDLPYCDFKKKDLLKLSKDNDIEFTIHLSEKIDVGELNDDLRKAYLKSKKKIVILGTKNNIKRYNLHIDPGIHFSLPDKKVFIYEQYLNQYKKALKKSCDFLNGLAEKYGVYILFENVKMPDYLKEGAKIISTYNNLFFTLDMGHNIRYGNIAQEYFEQFPNKIKNINIHDFNGEKDHLPLGTGLLNVKERVNYIKENNLYAVIEVKREQELVDSVKYLNTIIKKI